MSFGLFCPPSGSKRRALGFPLRVLGWARRYICIFRRDWLTGLTGGRPTIMSGLQEDQQMSKNTVSDELNAQANRLNLCSYVDVGDSSSHQPMATCICRPVLLPCTFLNAMRTENLAIYGQLHRTNQMSLAQMTTHFKKTHQPPPFSSTGRPSLTAPYGKYGNSP
jgi:hypothetical protein